LARLVLRVTLALTGTPVLRAPMASQARMEQMGGAALLERQAPKAPRALTGARGAQGQSADR